MEVIANPLLEYYAMVLSVLFVLGIYVHLRKVRKIKSIAEAQKLNLKKEMEEKLRQKTTEAAKIAKESQKREEVLKELKDLVDLARRKPEQIAVIIPQMQRLMDQNKLIDEIGFELQMDELNSGFHEKLKSLYPELTTYDVRLCAYIKAGIEAKEIARLQNIRPSSVYINRSRLRKKLQLEKEQDLFSFLLSLSTSD